MSQIGITIQHKKEALGHAYVRAVVAKAGYNFGGRSDFDYGFDGTIKDVINRNGRYFESGFGLGFQLKSSCDVSYQDGMVLYDLESKNYNDLVMERTSFPNILILFVLPEDESIWLDFSPDRLIIQRCAWWCSLEGQPPTPNISSKRIKIPEQQVFSPDELQKMMENVKGGVEL